LEGTHDWDGYFRAQILVDGVDVELQLGGDRLGEVSNANELWVEGQTYYYRTVACDSAFDELPKKVSQSWH
jgi:hypothetical protein